MQYVVQFQLLVGGIDVFTSTFMAKRCQEVLGLFICLAGQHVLFFSYVVACVPFFQVEIEDG